MKYRKLGRTGLNVSCIGFGGIPLAGLDEEDASRVLNATLDAGINFIDTARGYRQSETLIGKSISERRSEFILATKTKARDKQKILEELETSLSCLRTERIDLYQIHYVNKVDELSGVLSKRGALEVLKSIREKGTIRYIGITGHDARVLLKAAQTGEFDTVQGAFSYIENDQKIIDLINYCAENDIGFIVQKPLAGGAITSTRAGLKWILNYPVSTVIPGMLSTNQVMENAEVGDMDLKFTDGEKMELDTIARNLDRYFCRRCYYCHDSCPEGIRIGVVLEFFGKAKIPENLSLMQKWYNGMEVNASRCTACGLCLQECPYELPIIDMLREAHELLK
ncbi:MAG: aldo/keto reductase [Spirochaetota bacterium]